jgi:lipoate-protein ligase A
MLFVDNRGITDARVNLALEEYVFRHKPTDEDVLLFYVNTRAIIIGRNQNTIEEIDGDVVAARDIQVVRRVSGGGAVYHDAGNLNFSFMTTDVQARFNRYDQFTRPVVEVLHSLGVPAMRSSRRQHECSATAPCCWTPISTPSPPRCAQSRARSRARA